MTNPLSDPASSRTGVEQQFQIKAGVANRAVGDDLVLLDMDNGQYYSLNGTGAFIWRLFEQTGTLGADEAVSALVATYEVDETQARLDVSDLLDGFVEQGLIAEG